MPATKPATSVLALGCDDKASEAALSPSAPASSSGASCSKASTASKPMASVLTAERRSEDGRERLNA